jgi:hypothetical protein
VDDLRYVSRIKIDSVISKGKGVPVKCHAATEFEWRYMSTLSLTLTLDGGGWSTPRPDRFTPRERAPFPIVQEAGCAPGPV